VQIDAIENCRRTRERTAQRTEIPKFHLPQIAFPEYDVSVFI